MLDDKYYVPKYLDEPSRWLFWTLDEAAALLVPSVFGLLVFDHLLVGLVIGMIFMLLLKKMKGTEGHHFLTAWLYWHLPFGEKQFKTLPPSFIREYFG